MTLRDRRHLTEVEESFGKYPAQLTHSIWIVPDLAFLLPSSPLAFLHTSLRHQASVTSVTSSASSSPPPGTSSDAAPQRMSSHLLLLHCHLRASNVIFHGFPLDDRRKSHYGLLVLVGSAENQRDG